MSASLVQFLASNLLVSAVLAAAAWLVQVRLRQIALAHLLWTVALVKLLTPPLFSLPLVPLSLGGESLESVVPAASEVSGALVAGALPDVAVASGGLELGVVLAAAWVVGSGVVLFWSLLRVLRFDRLLRRSSKPASQGLSSRVAALAVEFGLGRVPELRLTTARITPLVWWLGGRPRIYVPAEMVADLSQSQLRWILAHEVGHLCRGDHYVRWIEWLACTAFWWNPVTWWARRNLRINEEICCDALVLRTLQGSRHAYANSLLAAVEFLAVPGLRPPAVASEINSGGFLRSRFEMIVSKTPVRTGPRWLQIVVASSAALLLPLGVAYAQNPNVRAVAERLERAVKAGEMSKADMNAVLSMLKESRDKQSRRRVRGRDEAPRRDEAARRDGVAERIEAVGRRLRAAVAAGEMTEEEARRAGRERIAQIEARAKDVRGDAGRGASDAERRIEEVRRRVRAAVEAGEMTPEEARAAAQERIAGIRARMQKAEQKPQARDGAAAKMKAEYEASVRKLTEMVKAGKLSREDMQRKLEARRRGIAKKMEQAKKKGGKQAKVSPEAVWQRIERAVKNGDLTEREAKQRFMEWEKRFGAEKGAAKDGRGADSKARLQAMRKRLDEAVERGDMTKKEAKQKWRELRKQMAAKKKPETDGGPKKRRKKRDDGR